MPHASCDSQSLSLLEAARSIVLEWVQVDGRDPRFLADEPKAQLPAYHSQIADRFLNWINRAGFEAQLVEVITDGAAAYEVHWTHRGATFVGFKQGPPAAKPSDALLLACAALLQNDWCRKQIE